MTELRCVCGVEIIPSLEGYIHIPTTWMGDCTNARPADRSQNARYTYDPGTGATYVYLRHPIPPGAVTKTAELDAKVLMDYDADGNPLGIEIIGTWPTQAEIRRSSR